MSTGDDSVVTAVVTSGSADVDGLSPRDDVPVGTETVVNPGGSSDVVAIILCIS